jgi:hypothetical protein
VIFVVLNVILALLLFWFSTFIDVTDKKKSVNPLVNMILVLAFNCIIIAITLLLGMKQQSYFVSFLCRTYLFGLTVQVVLFTVYVWQYPEGNKTFLSVLFLIAGIGFSFFVTFFKFDAVLFNTIFGIQVTSSNVGPFNFTWYKLFLNLYSYFIPIFAVIMCFVAYNNTDNHLVHQQILLNFLGLLVGQIGLYFINKIATPEFHPMYISLLTFAEVGTIFVFYRASNLSILRDVRDIIVAIRRSFLNYILVALLAGLAFAILYNNFSANPFVYLTLFIIVLALLIFIRLKLSKIFEFFLASNSRHYATHMENSLATIDYTDPDLDITAKLSDIMQQNVNTEKTSVLLDEGDGILKSLHGEEASKTKIPLSNPIFKQLINENINVVLFNQIDIIHGLEPIATELKKTMEEASAQALIVLREGGNVFGLILLSTKHLGNQYTEYDFKTFNSLYSYFFLVGYYMKNIINEDVVGTVSREIKFSGQVISSIQENVDFITNQKFDIGYLSKAAHDIGSEYIDFIRLSDTRHLIILGDISGKGISVSMSVVILKSVIRTFLTETTDFKELIQKMNLFIRDNLPRGTFFAGTLGLLDEENNILYYVNCGTPGLFFYNHIYNNVIEIQGKGRILGFVKNIIPLVSVKKIQLSQGDMLFSCTDGFIEEKSLRNEKYGRERFQHSIIDNMSFPAERICKFVYQELLDFSSHELQDDVSMMIIKILAK